MLQSIEEKEDDLDIDEKESRDDSVDTLCLSCTILFECFSWSNKCDYSLLDFSLYKDVEIINKF